jgi:hypothetical protein
MRKSRAAPLRSFGCVQDCRQWQPRASQVGCTLPDGKPQKETNRSVFGLWWGLKDQEKIE